MNYKRMLLLVCFMLIALPTFAQTAGGGAGAADGHTNWVVLTAGFAMAIASGLAALGQGKAVASAVEGMARNPGAAGAIQGAMILGLAFMESLALFTLVIIFVKVV